MSFSPLKVAKIITKVKFGGNVKEHGMMRAVVLTANGNQSEETHKSCF